MTRSTCVTVPRIECGSVHVEYQYNLGELALFGWARVVLCVNHEIHITRNHFIINSQQQMNLRYLKTLGVSALGQG